MARHAPAVTNPKPVTGCRHCERQRPFACYEHAAQAANWPTEVTVNPQTVTAHEKRAKR